MEPLYHANKPAAREAAVLALELYAPTYGYAIQFEPGQGFLVVLAHSEPLPDAMEDGYEVQVLVPAAPPVAPARKRTAPPAPKAAPTAQVVPPWLR